MSNSGEVLRVIPGAAIPGAEVAIEYEPVSARVAAAIGFNFDGNPAQISAAGCSRALVRVPVISSAAPVSVTTTINGVEQSVANATLTVGRKIISDVHPVANPAFHPTDGSLYVTRSGSRGEHVPVSIFRVDADGGVEEFSGDILNPTGIAFDPLGRMYVTSRFEGAVYRVSPVREVVAFAEDLGIATGLAFNSQGQMFVGDRSGTIYRVNEIGGAEKWAEHEPSVSAYHLAFGADDSLYVTGPTVSSFDAITRFDEDGNASTFYRGLGRPQGLAFDRDGILYVAASLRGRRGIVRISPDGSEAKLVVAGMNVVGLAFGPNGQMVVATNEAVFSLPLAIHGPLPT
jgi:sugar lactone lactonase YvrE